MASHMFAKDSLFFGIGCLSINEIENYNSAGKLERGLD